MLVLCTYSIVPTALAGSGPMIQSHTDFHPDWTFDKIMREMKTKRNASIIAAC